MRAVDRKSPTKHASPNRRRSRKWRVAAPARSPELLAFADALEDILRAERRR